jgi:hypothetical protein
MKLKLIYLSGINMHQHCGTNMVNLSCMATLVDLTVFLSEVQLIVASI